MIEIKVINDIAVSWGDVAPVLLGQVICLAVAAYAFYKMT